MSRGEQTIISQVEMFHTLYMACSHAVTNCCLCSQRLKMFPLAFLCSLLVISVSLEGLLGDKGKFNARDLYHTFIIKTGISVGDPSFKSYFDECLRYRHSSLKSILQCVRHKQHVNLLRRLSEDLKFEGYDHMKRCTRPVQTTIPLSTYSNNHDLSTSSQKHGVTTGAPIRLSESNQNIITSKPAAVNQLTNKSPSSDVTLKDRGRKFENTAALLKRVNVNKDFIEGTELGKAFTSIKNPQSAIANAGVMPDILSKKAKTGDFDGHRNRRGIFPFLCPRSLDRCMDRDRFIDFLKQTDGLGLNAQKLGKRKKIKRLLALQKMLQTTSSLPKQSNAQTTSALPKQSNAQTTSALSKQSNAQTTSSLPKQSNAQTTSALPKQSNPQTTSALPKQSTAQTTSSLPKQSHAQTTIPLSNDTHIDDLDTAELNDIGSSGEPIHLPEANQNIFISEPEYMNPNLTNELPPSALNEERIAGNELETFTNHVKNPPLTGKINAGAYVQESSVALPQEQNDVIQRLKSLQIQNTLYRESLKNMNSELSNLENEISTLKLKFNHSRNNLDRLREQTQDPKTIFQVSLNDLLVPSASHQGRRYWLTRKAYNIMVADAQAMCMRYGGYLAEMDTDDEFRFVRRFVMEALQEQSSVKYVITGGSDGVKEGEWINRYGLSGLTSLNWGRHEPNNVNNEDCQCIAKHLDWMMNDCNCNFQVHAKDATGFLCEIPE